jgi:hypothetical protein
LKETLAQPHEIPNGGGITTIETPRELVAQSCRCAWNAARRHGDEEIARSMHGRHHTCAGSGISGYENEPMCAPCVRRDARIEDAIVGGRDDERRLTDRGFLIEFTLDEQMLIDCLSLEELVADSRGAHTHQRATVQKRSNLARRNRATANNQRDHLAAVEHERETE